MYTSLRVNDDVNAIEYHVELFGENLKELFHQGHVERAFVFIILDILAGIKLELRVELDGVLASHESVRDRAAAWGSEERANTIDLVDLLSVRQVGLAEYVNVLEAYEI